MSCLKCENLYRDLERFGKCKAFPKGIPFIINSGEISHDKPLPDQDNDIVFERIKP